MTPRRLSLPSSLLPLPLLFAAATAQQPWQHLDNPTVAEVQRAFAAPPPEYGPEPYYGLNGPVTLAVVQHDLDIMKSYGYQAVTVQAGYGMPFAYLSPEYFAFFKQFVAEAKQRDMRVWIVDDAGYPSGFAGGKFTSEHPELRMQALAVATRIPAAAGATIDQPVGPNTVAVTALDTATHQAVAIPFPGGSIHWTAPAGNWSVVVVEHRFSTSPTRSDTNPNRVKDGSQSLEDYLDPAATAQYLAFTHEAYKKAVGDEFGKTILGFRGDEPDYSIAGLPWTPKFFARFESEKGYDIRPLLAGFIATKPADLTDLTDPQRRVKADYYDVFSLMFRDGFFKPQAEWCAANRIEYQVHLNHEEMEMQLVRSEGDFFRDMRYVQVPGIDSIWHQIWTDTISDFPRLASSAAHLYGHPRAFTESFAAYRPEPDVTMARYVLNEQFVRGVNLVETMYFPSSARAPRPPPPTGGPLAPPAPPAPPPGGGSPFMRDPAYPALMAYVRRMSFLMSQGRPDANVALFLPSSSMWLGDTASDAAFVSTERLLSERQIDFDIVDEDFLASAAKAGPGTLTTASGNSFRTVILPSPAVLSEAALTRLRAFAKSGGKVLFLGRAPALISGRTIRDARPSTPADFTWATVVDATLPETPTPPAQPPTEPPSALVVPAQVVAAVTSVLAPQDVAVDTSNPSLHLIHRKLKDAEVFLFFNESDAPLSPIVSFPGAAKTVSAWDPQTGAVTLLSPGNASGKLATPLDLKPYETRILVLR